MVTLHEVITFLVSMQISISSLQTHNVNRCGRSRHLARKLSLRRKRSSPNVFEMAATETITSIILIKLIRVSLGTVRDRKSGSAGMPRPISYAVFCLKKKKNGGGDHIQAERDGYHLCRAEVAAHSLIPRADDVAAGHTGAPHLV